MKRIAIILLAAMAAIFVVKADSFGPMSIKYNVKYHLGFIEETAATGILTMQATGDSFTGSLAGQSIPWGGRVYTVRDTLQAVTTGSLATKDLSQKITYRNGWYFKPEASLLNSGKFDVTNPANYRTINGAGQLSASPATMEAIGISANMLGLFYIFQELDFDSLQSDQVVTIPVTMPDGTREQVYLTYLGPSTFGNIRTWQVRFVYTYQGRRSDYPVTAQIDSTTRLPLSLSAHLAIGQMEMIQENSTK